MANTLTTQDVYSIVNTAYAEMYGANATLTAFDTTSFVAVGEQMLRTGYDATLNAISKVIAKTIIDVRPYKGKYRVISSFSDPCDGISRKISFFVKKAEESQNIYSNLYNASTKKQLDDGESLDHYKISKKYPVELTTCGSKTLQYHYTTFIHQIRIAFKDESAFSAFYVGMATAIANDIEHIKETESMLQTINYLAALKLDKFGYNLVTEFNKANGTNYTWTQLQTTYKEAFLKFFVAFMKKLTKNFEYDTERYHKIPYKTDDAGNVLTLLRHTPLSNQKCMLYEPFFIDAEANVLPTIFNDQYLKVDNYEGVMFWQNPEVPSGISCKPNHLAPDLNGKLVSTDASAAVTIPYVLGVLFDEEALKVKFMLDFVNTTPVNAAGDYFNTYYHWLKNFEQDETQNGMILFCQESVDCAKSAVSGAVSSTITVPYYGSVASPTIVCSDTGSGHTSASVSGSTLTITLGASAADGTVTLSGTGADDFVISVDVA